MTRSSVDSLDPCGIYFGTTGGQVYASANAGDLGIPIVRDLPCCTFGRSAAAAMIRVVIPAHLRSLAAVGREVEVQFQGPVVTQRSVLECSRRPIRCCEGRSATRSRSSAGRSCDSSPARRDLSHEPPDAPLPEAVAQGTEPLWIVGAIAGG